MREALLLLCLCAAGVLGCRATERIGREVLRNTPGGGNYLREFDRYAKIAKTLKKFHDGAPLDEGDILDVLYGAGVLKKVPPARPGRPAPRRPHEPKPFPVPVYKGAWQWPLEAGVVSSEFGPRWGKMHHGLDIAADKGAPVHASADGEVVYSGDGLRGYGNVVILRHDEKTTTLYAHNRKNLVRAGEKVARGGRIAELGSTGKSTGPHVHYEIRGSKGAVNPRKVLPKSRF